MGHRRGLSGLFLHEREETVHHTDAADRADWAPYPAEACLRDLVPGEPAFDAAMSACAPTGHRGGHAAGPQVVAASVGS